MVVMQCLISGKLPNALGTLKDFQQLQKKMRQEEMYLMVDIVLNHTSHRHEWAVKAKQGDKKYQDYFYMFDDRVSARSVR